ncbi:unnamed protein product [Agarophyton chilense]
MATILRSLPLRRVAQTAPAFFRPSLARAFSSYPSDRKYKASHEWAKKDGDVVTVGITDHAQSALGDIVFADLPDIGAEAVSGERTATVESVKAAADIYSPLTGEIVGVNSSLTDEADLINSDPHDGGWIFQVKVSDPAEFDGLLSAEEYEKTLAE